MPIACNHASEKQTDATLLTDAWWNFGLSEFSIAEAKFRQVLSQSPPNSDTHLQAEYGIASVTAIGAVTDAAAAKSLYEQIIREAPQSDVAPWCALSIARLTQQTEGTETPEAREAAATRYREVIGTYANTAAADEAFVHLQALRLVPLDPIAARGVIDDITDYLTSGKTRFASPLYNLRARAHRTCKDFKPALDDLIAAIDHRESEPDKPTLVDAGALYAIGVSAQFDVGDAATARKYYAEFLKEYPNEQRAFTVRLLLKNLNKTEGDLAAGRAVPPAGAGF